MTAPRIAVGVANDKQAGARRGGAQRRTGASTLSAGASGAIVAVATIGGFLFGYDSGAVNGTQDGLTQAFHLVPGSWSPSNGLGFTVASLLIGCFIGAFFAGRLADLLVERGANVVLQVAEAGVVLQMGNIPGAAGDEVVHANDNVPLGEEAFGQVRADKASATGDQNAFGHSLAIGGAIATTRGWRVNRRGDLQGPPQHASRARRNCAAAAL